MKKLIIAMLGAVALLLALFISPAKASDIPGANGQKLPYPLCITSAKASMNLGIPVTKRGALCALPIRKDVPKGWKVYGWFSTTGDFDHLTHTIVYRGYVPALDK